MAVYPAEWTGMFGARLDLEKATPPQRIMPIATGASTSADSTRREYIGSPRLNLDGLMGGSVEGSSRSDAEIPDPRNCNPSPHARRILKNKRPSDQ